MMFLSCCRKGKYFWICFASVRWLAPHRHCLQKATSKCPSILWETKVLSCWSESVMVLWISSWYSSVLPPRYRIHELILSLMSGQRYCQFMFVAFLYLLLILLPCSFFQLLSLVVSAPAHQLLPRASTNLSAFIARKSTRGLLDVSALKMYLFRITSPDYIHSQSRSFCIWTLLCSYIQSPCSVPLLLHILVLRFLSWIPVFQNDASSSWLLE